MCAIVSDSTGNTRLHRELLVNEIPTMFNLPDIVHFISNTIKDIVKLEYFKPTITTMRGVITKFHKSHLGIAELSFANIECHITRGLEAIGKTRFGTIILAAWALQYNIPAIKRVVEREKFDLGVCRCFISFYPQITNRLQRILKFSSSRLLGLLTTLNWNLRSSSNWLYQH